MQSCCWPPPNWMMSGETGETGNIKCLLLCMYMYFSMQAQHTYYRINIFKTLFWVCPKGDTAYEEQSGIRSGGGGVDSGPSVVCRSIVTHGCAIIFNSQKGPSARCCHRLCDVAVTMLFSMKTNEVWRKIHICSTLVCNIMLCMRRT